MVTYPYVPSPDKLPAFFQKIGGIGVPSKLTNQTLKSIGFTSSNDSRLLSVVKFLRFVDGNGVPTQSWTALRKHPASAIAQAVTSAYSSLFEHYPDAHQRDDEALRTFFSANTNVGSEAVRQTVATFKALAKLGDFSAIENPSNEEEVVAAVQKTPKAKGHGGGGTSDTQLPVVNLNIQLQLPSDASAETFERFFEAMRKHLFNRTQ